MSGCIAIHHFKSQIEIKNLRIVAQLWTLSESPLFRLYFDVFQPSVWPKDDYGSIKITSILLYRNEILTKLRTNKQ